MRELARKVRHAHRPWRIVRWRDDRTVVFSLDAADCPHCPDCDGVGGWWIGGGEFGEEPEIQRCPRCAAPLAEVRIPDRLYRRIPGAPVVFVPWQSSMGVDDDPPF